MISILGVIAVIGAVIGGFLMEKGKLLVLVQPAELVIIGGAALGTMLIANPLSVVMEIIKGALGTLKPSRFSKALYMESLKLLNEIFAVARKEGLAKLEQDIENPGSSPLFSKYPNIAKDHFTLNFICDTLRMALAGGVGHFELDQMMELDIEVHHHESSTPISALSTVADALPGLGIVAAVLGVVITMGALGGPPEEIGHKVAAALVGTFLGILLCYGFIGPLAAKMKSSSEEAVRYYHFLRVALISYIRGAAPILALEFGRRTIPNELRPAFKEMESSCKGGQAVAA